MYHCCRRCGNFHSLMTSCKLNIHGFVLVLSNNCESKKCLCEVVPQCQKKNPSKRTKCAFCALTPSKSSKQNRHQTLKQHVRSLSLKSEEAGSWLSLLCGHAWDSLASPPPFPLTCSCHSDWHQQKAPCFVSGASPGAEVKVQGVTGLVGEILLTAYGNKLKTRELLLVSFLVWQTHHPPHPLVLFTRYLVLLPKGCIMHEATQRLITLAWFRFLIQISRCDTWTILKRTCVITVLFSFGIVTPAYMCN